MIVLGIDSALRNMGLVPANVARTDGGWQLQRIIDLELITTERQKDKVVRRSSDNLYRAQVLVEAVQAAVKAHRPVLAFAEVPSGGQSASAASAFGIVIGVLACLKILGVPIIEVSPMEVKNAVAGHKIKRGQEKAPDKAAIIEWAGNKFPDAPWLRAAHAGNSKGRKLAAGRLINDNEHLADATAVIVAGLKTPEFLNVAAVFQVAPLIAAGREREGKRRVALLEPPR